MVVVMELIKEKILSFFEIHGGKILLSIVVLIAGLIIVRLLKTVLKKILKRTRLDPICHKFILSLMTITLYAIVVITALNTLGVPMTSVITMLGVAGLAVSLAIQDSLANLAGGFILLFTKPFKVGDFIEITGITGTVKHINILQTKLYTVDNKAIFIPNGQLSAAKIINYSAEEKRRLDLTFSAGYDDDVYKVKRILKEIVDKNELALTDPEPLIRMSEHSDHCIKYSVKVWVSTENYWELNYDLLEQVKIEFDKNNISIPFPQIDIHMPKSE